MVSDAPLAVPVRESTPRPLRGGKGFPSSSALQAPSPEGKARGAHTESDEKLLLGEELSRVSVTEVGNTTVLSAFYKKEYRFL